MKTKTILASAATAMTMTTGAMAQDTQAPTGDGLMNDIAQSCAPVNDAIQNSESIGSSTKQNNEACGRALLNFTIYANAETVRLGNIMGGAAKSIIDTATQSCFDEIYSHPTQPDRNFEFVQDDTDPALSAEITHNCIGFGNRDYGLISLRERGYGLFAQHKFLTENGHTPDFTFSDLRQSYRMTFCLAAGIGKSPDAQSVDLPNCLKNIPDFSQYRFPTQDI